MLDFNLNIALLKINITLILLEFRASDQPQVSLSGLWEEPGTSAIR